MRRRLPRRIRKARTTRRYEPDLRRHRHARRPPGRGHRTRGVRPRRRGEAGPRILLRQWRGGSAPRRRTPNAHLPRPQAARHPQHGRQGDRSARPPRSGYPHRPRRGRPGNARRRQGCGAAQDESGCSHPPYQPRPERPRRHRVSPVRRRIRSGGSPTLRAKSGLDGIVCSGSEVAAARTAWPDGFFVVPGVRPAGAAAADQKRVVTPRKALDDGASILVIGRPITDALDPERAIADIAAGLTQIEART